MARRKTFDIAAYCESMERHLGDQDGKARLFWQALSYAVAAHEGQRRKSGEAYVSHPLEVARILVEEMQVTDPRTLSAAVLHDTLEDVPEVTGKEIRAIFGEEVEAIVEGCTKISFFDGDRQAFSKLVHRKIFAEAASRIEVLLIKLADRLHNLRTLESMPKHKRQKISEETLDIYAPLAKVLGLFDLKRELYNLALTYKFPRQSSKALASIRQLEESDKVAAIVKTLRTSMESAGLECEILPNAKGLWAYFDHSHKVLEKNIPTPIEFIIITRSIPNCYQALGAVNQAYPPIPRTIRDFIANTKESGYQCIHTRSNIKGMNCLFKIRTAEMHKSARVGIIRQWSEKKTVPSSFEKEISEMLDILGGEDELSYRDLLAAKGKKEIYTYTPKGDAILLPKQSIVLDFAFKVHTDIGKRCVSAMVGRRKVSPDHILQDSDRVDIICQKNPVRFETSLLDKCQTPKARSELNRQFRTRRESLAEFIGESIMHQELKRYGMPVEILKQSGIGDILAYFSQDSMESLYRNIGEGNLRLQEIIYEIKHGIYVGRQTLLPPTGSLNRIELHTLDPVSIKLSRCCNPVPTEKSLYGLLSTRGLSVHLKECQKITSLKIQREDIVELRWRLKETAVTKPQVLILEAPNRQRIFMLLSVAPDVMRILEVVRLSRLPSRVAAWEINFRVETLHDLKTVLNHFTKADLRYEFILDL